MPKDDAVRIGVVSDSHGDQQRLFLAARRLGQVDALCFLGDVVADAGYLRAQIDLLGRTTAFYVVRGNNDFTQDYPGEITFSLCKKTIWLTHGHLYGVKQGLTRLAYAAQERAADLVLFGHTHVPCVQWERGILFFNPGSAGFHHPSCGLLTLSSEGVVPELISL